MFGNLGEMAGLMKKFKDIQGNLKESQEEMKKLEIMGRSSDGQVEVLARGDFSVEKIFIKPDLVALNDSELIGNLVLEAVNDALGQVKSKAQEQISDITGGLNIPGLFG